MIPHNRTESSSPLIVNERSVINMPSPRQIQSKKGSSVRIGSDLSIGKYCIIYGNVFIGSNFSCGNNVMIREGSAIGDYVTIRDGCCIGSEVSIADKVTIEPGVAVPPYATIGEGVFIGPNVRFMENAIHEKSRGTRPGITLEDNCMIGANAVLYPGTCVGEGARVAAGTVIRNHIPPKVIASGNPVRFKPFEDYGIA